MILQYELRGGHLGGGENENLITRRYSENENRIKPFFLPGFINRFKPDVKVKRLHIIAPNGNFASNTCCSCGFRATGDMRP